MLDLSVNVRVAVGAYILRKQVQGDYQLLLFAHPDCPEDPIQLPGGGVDKGESLEAALYREIWEESGLTQLRLMRPLGMTETCWIQPRKLISQRHYFLLETTASTPDRWQHCVQGTGVDAGTMFTYFWHSCDRDQVPLTGASRHLLQPDLIPELFRP